MNKVIIVFILGLFTTTFFAQENNRIDSLLTEVNKSESDSNKVENYILLANEYYTSDLDTTLYYSEQALELSRTIGYDYGIAKSISWVGYIMEMQGDPDAAIENYKESLKLYQSLNDDLGVSESYANLGLVYYAKGKVEKALEYHFKCLTIRENLNDERGIAEALNNIAIVYYDNGKIEEAIVNFEQCLAIQHKIGDQYGRAYSLNNLSAIYYGQGEVERGLDTCLVGIEIRKEVGDLWGLAFSYNNAGMMYDMSEDLETGLSYYIMSLDIHKELGDLVGIATMSFQIGESYLTLGDKQKAMEFAVISLEKSKVVGYPSYIQDAALLLKKLYFQDGRYKEAYEMLTLYGDMKDSVMNEENRKSFFEQNEKYKYEKQAAADSVKTAEENKVTQAQLSAQKAQIKQEETMRYTLYGGLGLLIVFGGFMYSRYRVTNKQKKIISSQKDEVEKERHKAEVQKDLVEEKNKEIMDSINYAKRIQSAILPPSKVVKEYLQDSFILYKPKDIVAGDFYWLEHQGGKVLFAAADCTGHGVPGAMVSVVCNNGLNRSVREHGLTDPGDILNKTREIVIAEFEKSEEDVKDGMDIALCSLEGMILKYAGANNPLWIIRDGEVLETKANKQPIGKFDKQSPYTTHTFELQKGDSIYIFSDGYIDQFGGERGKKFKAKAFRGLLLSIQNVSMEEQRLLIDNAFEDWRGDVEQIDDVCVIGVRI